MTEWGFVDIIYQDLIEFTISGGNSEGVPPVPIPNTEVKPFSAENTSLETGWKDKTLPDFHFKELLEKVVLFLFLS